MLYCTFMGGDAKITHVHTSTGNGRRLAIFKDSYGNALPQFLFGSFEDVYVLDMRYFTYNAIDYLKEKGITDLLFANNAFHATTKSTVTYYNNFLVQGRGSAVTTAVTPAQTAAPVQTTAAATDGQVQTAVPAQTTAPVQTTAAAVPTQTTAAPAVPAVNNQVQTSAAAAPAQTTAAPAQTTAAPAQTTAAPAQTTAASAQTTAPAKTTAAPAKTTAASAAAQTSAMITDVLG